MKSYIIKINLLFFNNNNEIVNNLIELLDKLKDIIYNKRLYDDYSRR